MKKPLQRIPAALFAFLVIVSLLTQPRRSEKADAPLLSGAQVPPEVMAKLRESCQDCHSEATYYPWYSYIAPVSFLINDDVRRGREHLNLSAWSEYSLVRRQRCLSEIANQVKDGGMPPSMYTLIHRGARLSESDVNAIFQWTQTERSRLIAESSK